MIVKTDGLFAAPVTTHQEGNYPHDPHAKYLTNMNVERGSDEKSYLTEFKTLTAGCPACGAAAAELDWAGGCRVEWAHIW